VTVAYDSNGAESWISRYRGPDDRDYDALALGVDTAGNIVVTGGTLDQSGAFGSAYATVEYDSAGGLLWASDAAVIVRVSGAPG
jgi:hypothetical protein